MAPFQGPKPSINEPRSAGGVVRCPDIEPSLAIHSSGHPGGHLRSAGNVLSTAIQRRKPSGGGRREVGGQCGVARETTCVSHGDTRVLRGRARSHCREPDDVQKACLRGGDNIGMGESRHIWRSLGLLLGVGRARCLATSHWHRASARCCAGRESVSRFNGFLLGAEAAEGTWRVRCTRLKPGADEMAREESGYTSSNAFVASPNFGRRTFILSIIDK